MLYYEYTNYKQLLVYNAYKTYSGTKRALDDPSLTIAPGKELYISLTFEKHEEATAPIMLYIEELDANGNHISWNGIDADLSSGFHNYVYTIKSGHKAVLHIDREQDTSDDINSYFIIDNVSIMNMF